MSKHNAKRGSAGFGWYHVIAGATRKFKGSADLLSNPYQKLKPAYSLSI